jgi:ABC-type lipoprotein export system ATPase subunit
VVLRIRQTIIIVTHDVAIAAMVDRTLEQDLAKFSEAERARLRRESIGMMFQIVE